MTILAFVLIAGAALLLFYTYVGYPLLLRWAAPAPPAPVPLPDELPTVSICVPAYNEEAQIRGAIESLLALDYPAEKRQIIIVSDASTDRTDEIAASYASRGVELLRLPRRSGKTAAENAAAALLHGEIVVNTDASIRIRPDALRPLVAPFRDPEVGVTSGRDVSVAPVDADSNRGESGYVGYEMEIRALETRMGGIVGASGCLYAIRPHLHRKPIPDHLSRDFASALTAREHGYRSVSVDEAICLVPRTVSLRREYGRKVRTMTRGMETLFFKRHLMNPLRYGCFAWMLISHKVCRWAVPWAAVGAVAGLAILAGDQVWARATLAAGAAVCAVATVGWLWPNARKMPRILALPAFALAGNVAALHSLLRAIRGSDNPAWEPTRREVVL
ncbi:MAG TPA: glycosyltransferase [Longimicrobium sp.]|jgi:cellulose synthase/poly-beta-1,6-N-acetylglucosamine synthase-like glycosyltransferase